MNQKILAFGLALFASLAGIVVAAAAAMERGGSHLDRALMVGVSVVLVLCAHLLPAISRSWASRALWVGCLLAVAWGHAAFFKASSQRAGGVRADAVAVSGRAQALQVELAGIQARPVAVVSADAAAAAGRAAGAETGRARCERATPGMCGQAVASAKAAQARASALADELGQARRGAALRGMLADEAGRHDSARAGAATDPVAAAVAALTGTSAGAWSTGVSVLSALLVELLAALLWSVAFTPAPKPAPERPRGLRIVRRATAPARALPDRSVRLLPAPARDVIDLLRKGVSAMYRGRDSPAQIRRPRALSQKSEVRPIRASPA